MSEGQYAAKVSANKSCAGHPHSPSFCTCSDTITGLGRNTFNLLSASFRRLPLTTTVTPLRQLLRARIMLMDSNLSPNSQINLALHPNGANSFDDGGPDSGGEAPGLLNAMGRLPATPNLQLFSTPRRDMNSMPPEQISPSQGRRRQIPVPVPAAMGGNFYEPIQSSVGHGSSPNFNMYSQGMNQNEPPYMLLYDVSNRLASLE